MFIRHCPDSKLSLIFKCKPLQLLTAVDVHDKLAEQRRDQRHSSLPKVTSAIPTLQQEVSSAVHSTLSTGKPTKEPAHIHTSTPASQGSTEQLQRIITMLERVLEQRPQQLQFQGGADRQYQKGQKNRGRSVKCVGMLGT